MPTFKRVLFPAGNKEGSKKGRKPSRVRDRRHEALGTEWGNVSGMGPVQENLWNKRRKALRIHALERSGKRRESLLLLWEVWALSCACGGDKRI